MNASDQVILCGLNARYVHTNLALRDLAAYVREHWQDAPQIEICEWTINDQELQILQRLYRQQAAIYAFSCYIWNITLVRRISRDLKKLLPEAIIVWGGPEAGFDASRWLETESAVDLIIRGEGEAVWLALLQHLYNKGSLKDLAAVPNLSWRDPNTGVRENSAAPLLDSNSWPFPYTDDDLGSLKDRIIYYETSRGCPFCCSYCLSALDRTVRHRPLPLVFAELDRLMAAGLQQVKLVDRTFNCDPARAFQIWQYIIERSELAGKTNFHFEVAGDLLDDRTTDLLNQAPPGLIQLEIGVQTIQPDVLTAINRPVRLEVLARQVERLRKGSRVHLHLDLIAGLPGEGLDRFSESLDWVYRLRPHQLQLGFLKVLPGTPMQQQAINGGFRWQDEPPYEILQSDSLDFADLTLLKSVEQIIDHYLNNDFCDRVLNWLISRQLRPWQVLAGFAVWAGQHGLLDRSLGAGERCRMLYQYGLASDHELSSDVWLGQVWRDLLRLDYLASGQKDQPEWLAFEQTDTSDALRLFKQRHPASGRLRVIELVFDWLRFEDCGELLPAKWLLCLDFSGNRPAVLDNCRADVLY